MTPAKDLRETSVVASLRRVLLGDPSEGVLSDAEMQAFLALAGQIPDAVMLLFLGGLSGTYRRKMLKGLPLDRQRVWLAQCQDPQEMPLIFASLPHVVQKELLSDWFVSDRERYLWIKASASQRTIVVGDIWVRTDTALPQLIRAQTETVLDAIQNPALSTVLFSEFLASRVGKYPPEALESIGVAVLNAFMALKIGLSTPASFLMHLKCHLYHDHVIAVIPGIVIPAYGQLLEQFCLALGQMPDGDWGMKVLAQMPPGALKQILQALRDGQQSSQEGQRKTCLRLMKEIAQRVDRPEFEAVRLAYAA